MCPNCVRGLNEKREVCVDCNGTGVAQEKKQETIVEKIVRKAKGK